MEEKNFDWLDRTIEGLLNDFEGGESTVGYLRRWLADTFNLSQMFIATFANTVLGVVAFHKT